MKEHDTHRGQSSASGEPRQGLRPLEVGELARRCDGHGLDFEDTSALADLTEPLGQERALEAIGFGTAIDRSGYNLYVMGAAGLGRHRILARVLGERAEGEGVPPDWCYVADFDAPDRPRILELPAGRGGGLRRDMRQFVEDLLAAIPTVFQGEDYRRQAQEIQDDLKQREEAAAEALAREAAEHDIALLNTSTGYSLAPVREGKLLGPKEFQELPEDERERRQAAMEALRESLRGMLAKVPQWQQELRERFRALDQAVTRATVERFVAALIGRYADLPAVVAYLETVREDVVTNGAAFRGEGEGEGPSADDARFTRYRVNLLVDNSARTGAPVQHEDNPTYQNLVGRIEHLVRMGTLVTDFTLIKPGVLHRANGGYLVLDAHKVLGHPFAWDALKRALRSGEVRIEPLERLVGIAGSVSLEPAPVPLRLKVALVGDRLLYYLLEAYDPEFGELFKVAVDFNEEMPRASGRDAAYARLIATLQHQEGLRPLGRDAVCRVVDWAARRVGDGEKLSLHVGSLLDLLREADHFAGEGVARIDVEHVRQALEAHEFRLNRVEQRLQDAIDRGTVMIDVRGRQIAQVNGLALLQVGDHAFGSPVRISATARLGSGEVVDIERESNLGGDIHSKGVMILAHYLASRYARHQPLSVAASLVFEQSYGEVEGDSASIAELCALLSAIGDLSIDQSVAVTGSVNQHGQVQAVGGVNEKVEGFYDVCVKRGLTGRQGVVIPEANVKDLMLDQRVRDAVAAGRFTVYAAGHVDEVMARLTSMPAGRADPNGLFPPGSVNEAVQSRLFQWTAVRQELAGGAAKGPD